MNASIAAGLVGWYLRPVKVLLALALWLVTAQPLFASNGGSPPSCVTRMEANSLAPIELDKAAVARFFRSPEFARAIGLNSEAIEVDPKTFPDPVSLLRRLFLYIPDIEVEFLVLRYGLDGKQPCKMPEIESRLQMSSHYFFLRMKTNAVSHVAQRLCHLKKGQTWSVVRSIKQIGLDPELEHTLLAHGVISVDTLHETTDRDLRYKLGLEEQQITQIREALDKAGLPHAGFGSLQDLTTLTPAQLREVPIWVLPISARIINVLQRWGVVTLSDVTRLSEADLLYTKNLRKLSLQTLKESLAGYQLGLRRPNWNHADSLALPLEQRLRLPVSVLTLPHTAWPISPWNPQFYRIEHFAAKSDYELLTQFHIGETALKQLRELTSEKPQIQPTH